MDKNTKTVTRESDKFMLRLPQGMRETIAASAKENGRSMNAEIVSRLEQSFQEPNKGEDIDSLVNAAITKRLERILNAPGKSIFSKLLHATTEDIEQSKK